MKLFGFSLLFLDRLMLVCVSKLLSMKSTDSYVMIYSLAPYENFYSNKFLVDSVLCMQIVSSTNNLSFIYSNPVSVPVYFAFLIVLSGASSKMSNNNCDKVINIILMLPPVMFNGIFPVGLWYFYQIKAGFGFFFFAVSRLLRIIRKRCTDLLMLLQNLLTYSFIFVLF